MFAWLRADGPASIHFRWPEGARGIVLRCYCATRGYPIEGIGIELNGARVAQRLAWDADGSWFNLEAGALDTSWDENVLSIAPPAFYPAGPGDGRLLSIALGSVVFRP